MGTLLSHKVRADGEPTALQMITPYVKVVPSTLDTAPVSCIAPQNAGNAELAVQSYSEALRLSSRVSFL